MSFGLLDTGFNRKRLENILADIIAKLLVIYGSGLGTDPSDAEGMLSGVFAGVADEVWEVIDEYSRQFSPQEAVGAMLSQLVQLNGLLRNDDIRSSATCDVTSTESTIPAGSICANNAGDEFENLAEIAIGGGTGSGLFTATARGTVPVDAGTLTTVVTEGIGWDTVTNPLDGDVGQLKESDPALRRRRERSVEGNSTNTEQALTAALLAVANVLDARVIDNKESDPDPVIGTAGHSARCVVLGGADADIADTVWPLMPLGIKTDGAESAGTTDFAGKAQTVLFQRPTQTDIYMNIKTRPLANFPADGVDQITQSILDYVAGNIEDHENGLLGIGDSVIWGRMGIGPNTIPGHEIWEWSIGLSFGTLDVVNIDLNEQTLSVWDAVQIQVELSETAP